MPQYSFVLFFQKTDDLSEQDKHTLLTRRSRIKHSEGAALWQHKRHYGKEKTHSCHHFEGIKYNFWGLCNCLKAALCSIRAWKGEGGSFKTCSAARMGLLSSNYCRAVKEEAALCFLVYKRSLLPWVTKMIIHCSPADRPAGQQVTKVQPRSQPQPSLNSCFLTVLQKGWSPITISSTNTSDL